MGSSRPLRVRWSGMSGGRRRRAGWRRRIAADRWPRPASCVPSGSSVPRPSRNPETRRQFVFLRDAFQNAPGLRHDLLAHAVARNHRDRVVFMVRNSILARARLRWPVRSRWISRVGREPRCLLRAGGAEYAAQLVADAVLLGEFGDLVVECEAQRGFAKTGVERGRRRRLGQQAGNVLGARVAISTSRPPPRPGRHHMGR